MISTDTKQQLEIEIQEVQAWEQDQKDLWFWEKLGRLPFMLLDKVTPKFIQQKLGQAVEEIGGYVQNGGKYLISEKSILEQVQQNAITAMQSEKSEVESINRTEPLTLDQCATLPMAVMNKTADQLSTSRSSMAMIQGATTGIGGFLTLAVDIPAILGLSLKIIQEIAISYGFDPKQKEERIFAVKVMQFASSDIVGKKAILEDLEGFGNGERNQQMISQLQGWQEVIALYRDNFGWKKLFQLIPVAGVLFGAFINKGMLNDVAEAAKMLYRKRRALQKLEALGE
ncbi:MAG: EcsC family protein [Candidatus Pristimantibacillus lignocellulolyticus]|uniref:EcsC family protein n=1 Tax=Candidatus Pristimantibacillus lignocellulolyticus TaxID=2994561 RepID=A0A9J6ZL88_9BACL|nr:MAG: EcsC family protein [Candidatus Pristimantibacillus lignocellulolyticus]